MNLHLSVLAYRGTLTTNPVTAFAEKNETTSGTSHTTPTVTVPTDGSWVVSLWSDKQAAARTLHPPRCNLTPVPFPQQSANRLQYVSVM